MKFTPEMEIPLQKEPWAFCGRWNRKFQVKPAGELELSQEIGKTLWLRKVIRSKETCISELLYIGSLTKDAVPRRVYYQAASDDVLKTTWTLTMEDHMHSHNYGYPSLLLSDHSRMPYFPKLSLMKCCIWEDDTKKVCWPTILKKVKLDFLSVETRF